MDESGIHTSGDRMYTGSTARFTTPPFGAFQECVSDKLRSKRILGLIPVVGCDGQARILEQVGNHFCWETPSPCRYCRAQLFQKMKESHAYPFLWKEKLKQRKQKEGVGKG
ncbi:hypothetical protein QOT17_004954 [Balamuthia mandrillaris]